MNQEDIHALQEARREALSLTGSAILHRSEPDQECSLGWIDTHARPDIAGLPRVHRLEGAGIVETSWVYDFYQPEGTTFYYRCRLKTPVRARFVVAFPLPHAALLLEHMIAWKQFVLFPGPPPSWMTDMLTDRLDSMQGRSWFIKLVTIHRPLFLSSAQKEDLLHEGLHLSIEHPDLAVAFNYWVRTLFFHR